MFTSDVEEAWQEAVPESTHLVPQTFVDLQCFSVESNMFLLTDSEQRPAFLAFDHPIMVHIGISDKEEDEGEVKETQLEQRNKQLKIDLKNPHSVACFFRSTQLKPTQSNSTALQLSNVSTGKY